MRKTAKHVILESNKNLESTHLVCAGLAPCINNINVLAYLLMTLIFLFFSKRSAPHHYLHALVESRSWPCRLLHLLTSQVLGVFLRSRRSHRYRSIRRALNGITCSQYTQENYTILTINKMKLLKPIAHYLKYE